MTIADDIMIREAGRCGRITLNRPQALNALTYEMAMAIDAAIIRWVGDGNVDLVLIDAAGDRAFSAGGDIASLYESGLRGDYEVGRRFWRDEYRMNARIADYPKPYVALMDGIVMGGGAGISVHGSHRVVTERSMVAMPECGIGLVPDVGCSLRLARAPGQLGEFLAMTGWRMNAADAILAGFADFEVASGDLPALTARIEETANPDEIKAFAHDRGEATLAPLLDAIDRHFGQPSALDCLRSLEAEGSEFAEKAAAMIRRACPLSVACAFEIVRRVRDMAHVSQAVVLEYRFTHRSQSDGDFTEGVRAQIIDKDRQPKWKAGQLEDVTADAVAAMLAPLGGNELDIGKGVPA